MAQIVEGPTKVIQSAPQERIQGQGRIVEDIIDVNVSQVIEETSEVVKLAPQGIELVRGEQIHGCTVEEAIDVSGDYAMKEQSLDKVDDVELAKEPRTSGSTRQPHSSKQQPAKQAVQEREREKRKRERVRR